MDDDEQDIEHETVAQILQGMATQREVGRVISTSYPTDAVGLNVMAELSHRVTLSINEDSQ